MEITVADLSIAATGLVVGLVVGLTGMGGGALMTPILIIVFRVQPLTAIGSDLVASLFMKPIGGAVHWRHRTVEFGIVKWLLLSSVPFAFLGVIATRLVGSGPLMQSRVQTALGFALLLATAAILFKTVFDARRGQNSRTASTVDLPVKPRPMPTILVGAIGGLIVGMTSVGSGSLIIVMLMLIYPRLTSRRLVGTDLVQAVPLVGSAAFGHYIYGDFKLALTAAILVGAVPGVLIGSRLSARAPDLVVRPVLIFVLLASALKLVGVNNLELGVALVAMTFVLPPLWALIDAVGWQRHEWVKAGLSRQRWMWLQGLGALFAGPGLAAPIAYFATVRPRLKAAAASTEP
jgi:uncharacterized membrane protein YfcA